MAIPTFEGMDPLCEAPRLACVLPPPNPFPSLSDHSHSHSEPPSSSSASLSAVSRRRSVAKLTPTAEQSRTNLIVRKLAARVGERELTAAFAPFGEILSAAVMRNIHTGESLGTAFVRFAKHEEAERAMASLDGVLVSGRRVSIRWARRTHDAAPVGEARRKINKLFVRNIPIDAAVPDLTRLFGLFGPVLSVSLHRDTAPVADARHARRIAFVVYGREGAAARAAAATHNTCPFPSCRGIPLMVKLAEDTHRHRRRSQSAEGRTESTSSRASSATTRYMNNPYSPECPRVYLRVH